MFLLSFSSDAAQTISFRFGRLTAPAHHTIDRRLSGQHNHHQLQSLEGFLQVSKHGLNLIHTRCIFTETRPSNYRHTGFGGDLLQFEHKRTQCIFFNGLIWWKACNGPYAYFDAGVKLFVTYIPYTLIRWHKTGGLVRWLRKKKKKKKKQINTVTASCHICTILIKTVRFRNFTKVGVIRSLGLQLTQFDYARFTPTMWE